MFSWTLILLSQISPKSVRCKPCNTFTCPCISVSTVHVCLSTMKFCINAATECQRVSWKSIQGRRYFSYGRKPNKFFGWTVKPYEILKVNHLGTVCVGTYEMNNSQFSLISSGRHPQLLSYFRLVFSARQFLSYFCTMCNVLGTEFDTKSAYCPNGLSLLSVTWKK